MSVEQLIEFVNKCSVYKGEVTYLSFEDNIIKIRIAREDGEAQITKNFNE